MIEQIKTSCEAETIESCRLLNAIGDISATLASNLASAHAASHAGSMLISQVEFLNSAVNQFKHNGIAIEKDLVQSEPLAAIAFYPGENCPAL
jgi:hypothetical protein